MQNFGYSRANDLQEAVDAVSQGATPIAGGTELLNWMRLGADQSEQVVDITRVSELSGIEQNGDIIRIGALSTLNQIEGSDIIRENAPVLSEACLKAASAQLRNRATIGGNVLQRTRCPYYRAEAGNSTQLPWPCNKREVGSGCSAFSGLYDRASIFGWTGSCICNQPSDPAVALAALDATVHVVGPNGTREIPMVEFHLTQAEALELIESGNAGAYLDDETAATEGADALILNRLLPDEVIVAYSFTADDASRNSRYLKVRERESYEYGMVTAAVCLQSDGETVTSVRIALGSIAQKPWRLTAAETSLGGTQLTVDALTPILEAEFTEALTASDQEYKTTLARNAARRAILMAGGKVDG